ncbi:MAG: tRNA (adenosine(37)-N6)-dimethylallyltransferase MiaA [Treponema sp.]|jgi:tRNA dimethylallyltransferase|nr:tRNA (adenosine(37)-N6)-dimethylallyltransferase MiaA [Treponema sp.]
MPVIPVLVLFGPTASGKTGILKELFTGPRPAFPAEVVSADSMQVYRGMDIGTAKPDKALCAVLPHHLIDIRDPDEPFNAGDFVRLADRACADIARRGKLPVVAGGTGFYLRNFIFGLSGAPPSDPSLRRALKEELAQKGPEALRKELSRTDGESAERIHINDTYRLLRALEVVRSSGSPLSSFAPPEKPREGYDFRVVEIKRPREELYRRIELRCGEMFDQGLPAEVEGLFLRGYTPRDPGLRAIGYREFFVEEAGGAWRLSADLPGVKALAARNSRRYAKRQLTYFEGLRSIPGSGIITVSAEEAPGRISAELRDHFL